MQKIAWLILLTAVLSILGASCMKRYPEMSEASSLDMAAVKAVLECGDCTSDMLCGHEVREGETLAVRIELSKE